MSRFHLPLANGIRTDHPVPGLPFVDDSHIPLDDGPEAIEAVGRGVAEGMWGRFDKVRRGNGGWLAFTTDPLRTDLGWSVRFHPEHGRTVLLMPDKYLSPLHSEWWGNPLLFRAGGYWWDGTTWFRPGQVWDPVAERLEHRKAKAALSVSAADLLDGTGDPSHAHLGKVATFDPEAGAPDTWADHLALWAEHHAQQDNALPLGKCVVSVASPELSGDQLIGVPEMSALAGITASTLRGYISRQENSVPQPQANVSGRSMWSKSVAADWAEARRRSSEGVREALAGQDYDNLSQGAHAVRDRFAKDFHDTLWARPDIRKRWVLRHRNDQAVREVADDLAWTVALSLDRILPPGMISTTVRHAVLDLYGEGLNLRDKDEEVTSWDLTLTQPVATMLDWLIRHHPDTAQSAIGAILRDMNDRHDVPAAVTGRALQRALDRDSTLDETTLENYLKLVLPSGYEDVA
ncbi:hypothetical protein GCM10012285_61550 [Streptomyces kronopolitis]|uniref:Uncharacterized protein n=1 Tax=Streptomyces kronopolitis TaxID=1612435 RepID=A0ABQ2K2D9_9ACTN|nr:hypothetical protein [Streptomyces kronopolitis]GGN61953.1 hypothetical protein GCM10012285_61550 [Streptomyces kronopolitis]